MTYLRYHLQIFTFLIAMWGSVSLAFGAEPLITVDKSANKGQVLVGDVLTYTIRVDNKTARSYQRTGGQGGLIVRNVLPSKLRFMPGTASATIDGVSVTMEVPSGPQVLDFLLRKEGFPKGAGFELNSGSRIVIRFQAAVNSDARPGETIESRAEVRTSAGALVSKVGRSSVLVVEDSLLNRSWLVGRVYCDDDGDGWASEHDPGVYGARVYIDTGRYAVTDRDGKFHLNDIPSGIHLVKVDQNTVPPGSDAITPISRAVHFTRGMPQQFSFGFRCNLVPSRPNQVKRAEATAVPEIPQSVVVTGSLETMSVAINGQAIGAAEKIELKMMGRESTGELRNVQWGPRGFLSDVAFRTTAPKSATQWRLWLSANSGKDKWNPVRLFSGTGTPPSVVQWNGRDSSDRYSVVSAGQLMRAQLIVTAKAGMRFLSAPVYFTAGHNLEKPVESELSGNLFGRRGQPKGKLLRALKNLVRTLKKQSTTRVLVQVRLPSNPSKSQRESSIKKANRVAAYLVAKSRVESFRVGSAIAPGGPSIGLYLYDTVNKGNSPPRLAPKSLPPVVRVNGKEISVDKKGRFVGAQLEPVDGFVVAELRNKQGGSLEISARVSSSKGEQKVITANLAKRELIVGSNDIDLSLMTVRVRLPVSAVQIESGKPKTPLNFVVTPGDGSVASWRFRVTGPLGMEVFSQSGTEKLPSQVVWNDALSLEPGEYIYGLTVTNSSGSEVNAPSRVFVVSESDAEEQSSTDQDKPQRDWALKVNGADISLKEGVGADKISVAPGTAVKVEVWGPYGEQFATKVAIEGEEKPDTEARKTPFGIATLANAIARHKERLGPPPALSVAEMQAELPPDGAELGQPILPVTGQIPPVGGIQVSINGLPVRVLDFKFQALVPLKSGEENKVVIEARDSKGNVARIVRTYKVKGNALFLLALADGAVTGQKARLDGVSAETSFKAGKVLLHGRGALYLKARIKGSKVIDQWRFTAFADSARKREFEGFVNQIIDPNRYYSLYGDASSEHTDARTRGKYYLAVEADQSKLIVGAFKPDDWGMELLQYGRVMDGVHLTLKKAFIPGYETVLQSFFANQDQQVRRGFAVINGTGGSYYFLPDREIIEGSEQISLAIYDRDNGGLLRSVQQTQHIDYEIDYLSGRVMFKQPISSTVSSGFLMGASDAISGRMALNGHRVRILVDYQTRAVHKHGDQTVSVSGRQTFANMVTVGGGYLHEGHGDSPDYKLIGGHVKVTPTRTTVIQAEVAKSEASNGVSRLSHDGGLTYTKLSTSENEDSGYGISVKAQTDIGELLGKDRPYLQLSADFRKQTEGYVAAHKTLEQGTVRGGAQLEWIIGKKQRLVLRHDTYKTSNSNHNDANEIRDQKRSLTSAQYTHRFGRWTAVGEVVHSHESDDFGKLGPNLVERARDTFNRGGIGSAFKYKISPRLSLFLEQQFMVGGDDRIVRSTLDGFVTGVGMDINLGSDISLTISEHVRWSGEDAMSIGLRSQLSDRATFYVEQRLVHPRDTHRWVPATVVGSEERWGEDSLGRSYGEYQTGTGASGYFNRAVLGIGRRFKVMPGLYADIAVERSHSNVVDEIGVKRDMNTVSLGGEYFGSDSLKLTSRFEARMESGEYDRWQLVSFNRLTVDFGQSVYLHSRADMSFTQNADLDKREAESVNLSVGMAYRPLDEGISLLLRAARIIDLRPVDTANPDSVSTQSTSEVYSFEPIFELPLRFQLTPKLAYRHTVETVEGIAEPIESHTMFGALRLAFHVWQMLDVATEYRFLYVDANEQIEHGTLIEAAVTIDRYARIGAGYNFTHFSDDLFDPLTRKDHGFFVRLTGMY